MTPTMTRWQCEFVRRGRSIRWVVMAFGEASAQAAADKRCHLLGEGWTVANVAPVTDEVAA